ncbi:PilZ domain-containing protein [Mesorhizobium waimense]|uniref:PilZ domain-containing protein n=1 Tax=Mesorhizobium waimense TaxID=1300307 RepID=A0A3A5KYD9_9HYPH|nr:PilZ domain-containing protein [Mesorhizobium waimense]RJT41865.1 PilZ domain-containing protein [Mesorhizobium waimense]
MNMMLGGNAFFGERRAQRRRRALKGATLRFNNGFGAMEGAVRNESENGAQLSFGDTIGVPSGFELSVNGAEHSRSARVRWRSQTLVGVEFVD